MNKKAIAILGAIFLLIVGTLGFLIFSKSGSKKTDTKTSTASSTPAANSSNNNSGSVQHNPATSTSVTINPTPTSTPPATGTSGIVRLSDDQVISPAYFYQGDGISYFDFQYQLHKNTIVQNAGKLTLSSKILELPQKNGFSRAMWPNSVNDFIVQFSKNGSSSWSYYSRQTGAYTDYPSQIESVDWMPDGTHIAYVWVENTKATLNVSDPDTGNWKKIGDMWETDDEIHVSPDGKKIAYFETQNTSAENPIYLVTADGKTWSTPVKDGFNTGVLWSPDGQKFLYAKRDVASQSYQLWVYNLSTGFSKNLGYYTTADKAAWGKDSTTVYAAVPLNGGVQPGSLTLDELVKFSIVSTAKQEYRPDVGQSVDGRDLFLSPSEDKLFFRNAQDGYLYYLSLKGL